MHPNGENERAATRKLSVIERLYIPSSVAPLLFLGVTYLAASREDAYDGGAAAQAFVVSFLFSIILGIPGAIMVMRRKLRREPFGLLAAATLLALSVALLFVATAIARKFPPASRDSVPVPRAGAAHRLR